MAQTWKYHPDEITAGTVRLSSSFVRDAARATLIGNEAQLHNICDYHNIELTSEVEDKIDEKIQDARRAHSVQRYNNSVQNPDDDPLKYFLFAFGCLVLLIVGLVAGYSFFLYFAPVGIVGFLVKGYLAIKSSPTFLPFSHKNIV